MKIQHLNQSYSVNKVMEFLAPHITKERRQRMEKVISMRSRNFIPVLEKIFDQGNINAVLRSAESMGFQDVHIIQNESFRKANRVSKGSDKWLSIHRWQQTKDCLNQLKQQGYQILVTHLSKKAKPISDFDFSKKTALIYGSEGFGASKEALNMADEQVIIPMRGFTQSYNISVAAAISMYHVLQERTQKLGASGDLTQEEKQELLAKYILASCNKTMDKVREELIEEESK